MLLLPKCESILFCQNANLFPKEQPEERVLSDDTKKTICSAQILVLVDSGSYECAYEPYWSVRYLSIPGTIEGRKRELLFMRLG